MRQIRQLFHDQLEFSFDVRQLSLGGELSRPGLGHINSTLHSAEGLISFHGACAHDAGGYAAAL